MVRRKLALDAFFDRIAEAFGDRPPVPRRRVRGDEGLLVWRRRGTKAGVIVGPSVGGAFVFLGDARVQVEAVTEAVAVLEAVFVGEVIAVEADGPQGGGTWLARADAPAADIGRRYDRDLRRADVPVFTAMAFRAWPGE